MPGGESDGHCDSFPSFWMGKTCNYDDDDGGFFLESDEDWGYGVCGNPKSLPALVKKISVGKDRRYGGLLL